MLRLFKNHKVLFVITIILSFLASAVTIAAAFVLQNILDAVTEGDWTKLNTMIGVVVAYIVVVGIVMIASSLAEKKLVILAIKDIRADLHRGIFSRDTENYRQTNTADYLSALTNDVKIIEENILVPLLQAIQSVLVFLMAAITLFYYSPLIGGLMVVSLIALYILPASLGKPIGTRQEAYSMGLSLFTLRLKDQFAGYEIIRSFRLTDRMKSDFTEQNSRLAESKYGVDRLIAYSEGISQMIGAGSQLGVMLVAAFLILQGQMTAGALLAILQLSGCFVQPVAIIMQNTPKIQGAKPVLERIQELSACLPSSFQGTAKPVFAQAIRFEDVSFGYTSEQPVLTDLDVTFEKNKKYALVGGSGCGKTTLIKLVSAGYSTYTGAIKVDGSELHSLDINGLLTLMSVIHQDVYMFDETIKDNIDLHRSHDEDEWERALSISGVDRFLDQTGLGLETPVGENGINLSGGQRQRVAVARALIERKPILILDEGTSAVDARTAYDIETALLEIDDLTMITITHNLAPELLRRYDKVLFMEEGRIAEAGDFDTLIAQRGKFAAFLQIGGTRTESDNGESLVSAKAEKEIKTALQMYTVME